MFVGKMERSDQYSHLALLTSTMYIIRACLHIYGMYTSNRATSQSRDCQSSVGVERKQPLSPPLHSWSVIGQTPASHRGPTHRVPPGAGPGKGQQRGEQGGGQGALVPLGDKAYAGEHIQARCVY